MNAVKIPIEINEKKRLEVPLPQWVHDMGKEFWLLGMNIGRDIDGYVKIEILINRRKEGES